MFLKPVHEEQVSKIEVHFTSRRAFLASVRSNTERTLLCIRELNAIETGTKVQIKVSFGDSNRNFKLIGRVDNSDSPTRGVAHMLVMQSHDERNNCDLITAYCRGIRSAPVRYMTRFRCMMNIGSKKVQVRVKDVSMTGAFVVTRRSLLMPEGTAFQLELNDGVLGFFKTRISGTVAWSGEKHGDTGMGVHFVGDVQKALELMRKHVAN